ncbi:hypothetical protein BCR39DRAFT_513823 [Naematelia encephala]|uniref:Polysaccharide lyase 14 domain-containing protein n=1 Tax=Naematelia encephala TaxID=71784 RepID=A0A1Y2BJ91_9TREE|nr:hypothetical protein BCR39DRAFT_513823 [Naematelia encephala]
MLFTQPTTTLFLLLSTLIAAPISLAAVPEKGHPRSATHLVHARDSPARHFERGTKHTPKQSLVRRKKKRSSGCQVAVSVSVPESVSSTAAVPGETLIVSPSASGSDSISAISSASSSVDVVPTASSADVSLSSSSPSSSSLDASPTSSASTETSIISSQTSSTSSSAPAATSAASSGMLARLFPVASIESSWTTSTESSSALSISSALNPVLSGKLPAIGTAPDGSTAIVADFPAGTAKLASGQGFNFYSAGDKSGVDVTTAREVLLSYSAFFQDGFEPNKGGKMPGVFGGTSLAEAKSCSGGRQDERDACFSARMMWRTNSMGELYNYLPNTVTPDYCTDGQGGTYCNSDYGDSVGRGSFTWTSGEWTTVAMRIKLNDGSQANGEQQLWVNGESVLNLSGLVFGTSETKIYGIMAQTFFGGSDDTWASPIDQKIWFKDWSLAILS